MKNPIPQYTFYKTKYGSELLIDVVELKYIKRFLSENPIHTLTYYDITFITEGEGSFSIDNQNYEATPCDVFFSQPGEIRSWDTNHITNGYALIFEDRFLSALSANDMEEIAKLDKKESLFFSFYDANIVGYLVGLGK